MSLNGPPLDAPDPDLVPPLRRDAVVVGAARDVFLYYHVGASGADVNPLWEYVRGVLTNLVWVNDHFVCSTNPLHVETDALPADLEARHAQPLRLLRAWYGAKAALQGGDLPLVRRHQRRPAAPPAHRDPDE